MIFIPSPNVAEDHQTKNAMAILEKNAALMVKEKELESNFETVFLSLLQSEIQQKRLSENIKKLGKPDAAKDIDAEVERILKSTD